jgi:hypothetical protein
MTPKSGLIKGSLEVKLLKSRDGKNQTREEKKKEDQKEKASEERRSRCAKRWESRETVF